MREYINIKCYITITQDVLYSASGERYHENKNAQIL